MYVYALEHALSMRILRSLCSKICYKTSALAREISPVTNDCGVGDVSIWNEMSVGASPDEGGKKDEDSDHVEDVPSGVGKPDPEFPKNAEIR